MSIKDQMLNHGSICFSEHVYSSIPSTKCSALCEVARFCLTILGRGKGRTIKDLSLTLVETKEEMSRSYLAVLEIVENRISRNRANTLFELIETQLHIYGDGIKKQSYLIGTEG